MPRVTAYCQTPIAKAYGLRQMSISGPFLSEKKQFETKNENKERRGNTLNYEKESKDMWRARHQQTRRVEQMEEKACVVCIVWGFLVCFASINNNFATFILDPYAPVRVACLGKLGIIENRLCRSIR